MSLPVLLFVAVCAVFTSVISAVCGMAGGIVLLSVMTAFMPLGIVIPIHGVVQLVSNASRSFLLRKSIHWRIAGWYLLGLPFGVGLSMRLIKSIELETVPLLLIAALIFYTLFKPKKMPGLIIPLWGFAVLGVGSGFLSLLIGATGPLLAPFFLRDDLNRHQVISTKATVQLLTHFLKLPAFLSLGFDYVAWLPQTMLLTACALIGTWVGVKILGKLDEGVFRKIFKVALFLAALRIVWKAFS